MVVEWLWWLMGEVERAGAGNGDGGTPELRWLLRLRARTKEEPRKRKMGRGMDRAGTGGDNGRLWPVLAALDRALATRGHRGHHAAHKLCFCRPLTTADSVGSALAKPTDGAIWRGTNF